MWRNQASEVGGERKQVQRRAFQAVQTLQQPGCWNILVARTHRTSPERDMETLCPRTVSGGGVKEENLSAGSFCLLLLTGQSLPPLHCWASVPPYFWEILSRAVASNLWKGMRQHHFMPVSLQPAALKTLLKSQWVAGALSKALAFVGQQWEGSPRAGEEGPAVRSEVVWEEAPFGPALSNTGDRDHLLGSPGQWPISHQHEGRETAQWAPSSKDGHHLSVPTKMPLVPSDLPGGSPVASSRKTCPGKSDKCINWVWYYENRMCAFTSLWTCSSAKLAHDRHSYDLGQVYFQRPSDSRSGERLGSEPLLCELAHQLTSKPRLTHIAVLTASAQRCAEAMRPNILAHHEERQGPSTQCTCNARTRGFARHWEKKKVLATEREPREKSVKKEEIFRLKGGTTSVRCAEKPA